MRALVADLRSTPNALPALQAILFPLLTTAWISFSAPRALRLSTNTTTAALPLRLTSPAHRLGSALSSSSTTPSATTSTSLLLRFLLRCSSSSSRRSAFHRLCSGAAGTLESNSTLSTRAPPSWVAKSARRDDSVASMGVFARKRLRSVVAE
jgi:hypothetical protein